MSYLALYRKHRPINFAALVGQDHVVRTLKNALTKNMVTHAYLFSGVRGTGKTSMAKLLAKALNCLDLVNGEPCNKCMNCLKINEGNFMDIIEIDAASNRGIDEIRDLREKIKFMPVEGKMKVYIIDEVHMLTGEAFNALLKTLEEPPGHIVFILATTEPHKIPLTILSRCQKFDFHKIPNDILIERLKYIAEDCNGKITEDALILIAKLAGGGLRDAISLLDQCLTSYEEEVTVEDVSQIAGIVEDEKIVELFQQLADKNVSQIMSLYEELKNGGKSIGQLLNDIIEGLRNILIIKTVPNPEQFIVAGTEMISDLKEVGDRFTKDQILNWIYKLSDVESRMKYSIHPDILLEVELLKGSTSNIAEVNEEKPVENKIEQKVENKVIKKTNKIDKELPTIKKEEVVVEEEHKGVKLDGEKLWHRFIIVLGEKNKSVEAYYKGAVGHVIMDNILTIYFDEKKSGFHKSRAELPENIELAENLLRYLAGRKIKLVIEFSEELEKNQDNNPDDKIAEIFGDNIKYINE
ncbi:MAG: DNA polymerase III subunit gamma/tau [Firmicutes bacterium]|nr:DNA polymerase III subunit gamma/tau [Bacillota bacterium]